VRTSYDGFMEPIKELFLSVPEQIDRMKCYGRVFAFAAAQIRAMTWEIYYP